MRIKRRRVAYTFTLPAQVNIDIDVGSEARRKKNALQNWQREIALNLFSIFTVYNICHVIYSQPFVHIYICTFFFNSVYFNNTDWKSIPCRKHCQYVSVCDNHYKNRVNTDKCLIVSQNVFSVSVRSHIEFLLLLLLTGLCWVEKGREGRGKEKGKERKGATRASQWFLG